jgi:hypothetical protein
MPKSMLAREEVKGLEMSVGLTFVMLGVDHSGAFWNGSVSGRGVSVFGVGLDLGVVLDMGGARAVLIRR